MKFLENKYFAEEIPDITVRLVIKKLTKKVERCYQSNFLLLLRAKLNFS